VFTNSIFQIVEDVAEAEHMAVEDLKDEIDEEAEKIKEALPDRAKKIRDEVVEEVTGKKLDRIEEIKRRRREKHKAMVKKFREMHAKQDEYLKQKVDVSAPKKKMMVSSYDDKENSMKISKPPLNMGDEIGETMYASEDEDE